MTLSHCYTEKHQRSSTQGCGHQIHRIWIQWTTASRVSFKRRSVIVKALKECLMREWRLLDHSIIMAEIAQWPSCLSACVHVMVDILNLWLSGVFCPFIDTGLHEFDQYEHVQSANIVWNVLLLCPRLLYYTVATKRICGRKFLHQAFTCEVMHENLLIVLLVTAKNISCLLYTSDAADE